MQEALFAAGCFWGVQYYFDQVPGVMNTVAGYTGGAVPNPSYEQVCYGNTGHAEAVLIEFDLLKVSYQTLLKHFFRMHDPTQLNRQGVDTGSQYRSVVFYFSEDQKRLATAARNAAQKVFSKPIVTGITKAGLFYKAEEYHQKYTEKTGRGMCHVPYQEV